jgi:hypothetical protein
VVQSADFGKLHDVARHGELDRPEVGCVLVEREVGTRLMVISEIAGQNAVEVLLAEDDNVIQALAPDRADEPSAKGFCHGLCGAVRTSSIPMPFTRCRNG